MNTKTKKTVGIVAITGALLAAFTILAAFSPIGTFIQSSLISSPYVKQDAGLYIGIEQTASNGKELRAKQGVSLRSETAESNGKKILSVYITAHNEANTKADRLDGVMVYDPSKLTAKGIGDALKTVSANFTVDAGFASVEKDSNGKETGKLYFAVEKGSDFTTPKEEVAKIVFTLSENTLSADINVETLKMYKKADLFETAKSSLYLTTSQGGDTISQKLVATNGSASVSTTEAATNDGGKVRTDILKDTDGKVLKTTVTVFDDKGRIIKIPVTYADESKEETVFVYASDGSYTETKTMTDKDAKVTTVVKKYDTQGKSIASNTTTTKDSTVSTTTTSGVTTAVNNTTSTTDGDVRSSPATTTGTACTPSESEKFNDTIGHWSESIVEQARQKCIISGKSLGRFAPDEPVTRAELTKIAVEAFKVLRANGTTGFSDVSDSEWYGEYVRAARLAEIVNGYQDGTFRPNTQINRAEALKIVLEAGIKTNKAPSVAGVESTYSSWMSTHPTYTYVQFPDVKVVDWFGKYVLTAFQQSIVRGYNDRGTEVFRPGQSVTRAEAVKMIMSIIQ